VNTYTAILAGFALVGTSAIAVAEDAGNPSVGQEQGAIWAVDIDELEGKDVFDPYGGQLGDVDEIVVDKSNHRMAVIGLEDSAREVVVPIDELALSADGDSLTTKLTRAELETLPDYDPSDLDSVDE
jgi:hypothetical protein